MTGYFINLATYDGKTNMAIDEKLLNYSIANQFDMPILRFYKWNPKCVSIGRNQTFIPMLKLML